MSEQNSPDYEQWVAAKELVALLNVSPRFVTAAIHFLRLDVEENDNQMSHLARGALIPLLRSKSFQAVVYYSAKRFFPEKIKDKKLYTPRALSEIYSPSEFISLITLTYLYKRMKRGCDKELFASFMRNIDEQWMLSGATGRAIDKIGFANGLLYGSLVHLAQCLFLGIDKKRFKPYRVHLRRNNIQFDLNFEEKTWGCNCLQIAVLLAQHLGLGRQYHDPIILGVGARNLEDIPYASTRLYAARLLQVWVESLITTGEAPDMPHRGDFYPLASEMIRLKQFASEIEKRADDKFLFDRNEDDISETLTPELFAPAATETKIITLHSERPIEEDFIDDSNDQYVDDELR